MKHTKPEVFLIAKSVPELEEVQRWLEFVGVSAERRKEFATKHESQTPGESIVELAGRRCYMSYEVGLNPNVSKIRNDILEYVNNILKTGHGSVIEHAYYTFAIENVSRVFTGEMNRHRAGMAISEGSMRFIRFDSIPFWFPNSIQTDGHSTGPWPLEDKKIRTQVQFKNAIAAAETAYGNMQEIWKEELLPESRFHQKKELTSMMRRIVPMGVSTGGVWTGNLRAWRHIFTMRCAEAAEEEIQLVCTMMLEKMAKAEPTFFGDFKKNEKGFYECVYRKV